MFHYPDNGFAEKVSRAQVIKKNARKKPPPPAAELFLSAFERVIVNYFLWSELSDVYEKKNTWAIIYP